MHLILASASLGRKELLGYLHIPFSVIVSSVDEEIIIGKTPLETITLRARKKGEDVVKRITEPFAKAQGKLFESLSVQTESLIIDKQNRDKIGQPNDQTTSQPDTILVLSADSSAVMDGKLFGKPKDKEEAFTMIKQLSGKTHAFYTAVNFFLLNRSEKQEWSVTKEYEDISQSRVSIRPLSDDDITHYIRLTPVTRYAASYAISSAQDFIDTIDGSISNVIGLPLETVIPQLKRYGVLK